MNWEAIGAVGELIGALVVAVTLVFLVVQVKQNSRAINASITHSNIAGFNELNTMLAADPVLAEILDRGCADPSSLSPTESYQFSWIVRAFLNLFLNLYDQFLQGTCPEPLWRRHTVELQTFLKSPGARAFLKGNSYYGQLIEHIDSLPPNPDHRIEFKLGANDELQRGAPDAVSPPNTSPERSRDE
ncbi:MAG: hypothetical protein ABI859_16235 [Pseudomonadota bacterium]